MKKFKDKIRTGEIFEALTLAMGEAIELNITTWVATSEIDCGEQSQAGYRWHTRINLVDGEIENEIGSEFLKNPTYSELRNMHLEQVQEGRATLLKNIASLKEMFSIMGNTFPISAPLPQNSIDE